MNGFDAELSTRLDALREQGLFRELRCIGSPQSPHVRVGGQDLLNFSSNDYLGLANEPEIKAAAIAAIERYGAGAGASRLICGSLAPHHELDEALAAFKGTAAALSFATGYAAAVGAICALMGKQDVVILDKLVHASLVDAARLCGATLRVFAHNDLNRLEEILEWANRRGAQGQPGPSGRRPRALVVTESVFSMDGDGAPLKALVALKEKHRAWLMVDEAHATGLYGSLGRGLAEAEGVSEHIELQMGTLGKALGSAGGYLCGSRVLIDYLVNRARPFIFSTAPVPAAAAAATAAIRFVQTPAGRERRGQLWQRRDQLYAGLGPAGAERTPWRSAIVPLMIGDETKAMEAAAALRARGIMLPAIRFPTVARGRARLRLTLTAAHSEADIAQLLRALGDAGLGNEARSQNITLPPPALVK